MLRRLWVLLIAGCADEPVELTASGTHDDPSTSTFPVFTPPPAPAQGVQIHLEPFWLKPGRERERCWFVDAGNTGPAVIDRIELVARPGLHHSILIKTSERFDEHTEPCFGFPFGLLDNVMSLPEPLFGTSTQVADEVLQFPEGVGTRILGNQQLVLNYHYLNATAEDLAGEVWVNLHFAEPGTVREYAQSYFVGNIGGIDLPPRSSQELTTTCAMPSGTRMVSLTPHLHQRGRRFVARRDHPDGSEILYDDAGWFDPRTEVFVPPVDFGVANQLTFTCAWDNASDEAVRFGETSDDEMCFVFGHFTPGHNALYAFDGYGCDEVENIQAPL